MNKKLYIRFSSDIKADIERGYSFFKGGEKMNGLCAWRTPFDTFENPTDDEIIQYANLILKNTYGSYSDNSEFHLITGEYVGSGNDGVLLQNVELVKTFYI